MATNEDPDYVQMAAESLDVNRLPEGVQRSANALTNLWAEERGIQRPAELQLDVCSECQNDCSNECGCWCHGNA